MRSIGPLAAVALTLIAAIASLEAHEIGTTRVVASFPASDTYRVEVVTDAQAMSEKLGSPLAQLTSNATIDLFLSRLALAFDGHPIRPDVDIAVTPPADDLSPPMATITLTGRVPADAEQATWTYGWTFATYAFVVEGRNAATRTDWLEGGETSRPIALHDTRPAPPTIAVVAQYLRLGFTHIVPHGVDHVLFVLGLFLLSAGWRSLLWQVSAFTVAHTITLGLAIYGVVSVRPALVEPVIALSICYVAVENVLLKELRPWRVALVFAFGLLHGLGFAGALTAAGLPRDQLAPALVAFNIGVELGQLSVLGAAMLAVGWWRTAPAYRQRVVVPASLAIACVALYWTIERL